MSCELHKVGICTRLLAAAAALVLAGSAQAVTLVGGGATLPSVVYVGPNAALTQYLQYMGAGSGATNLASGSLFGVVQTQSGNSVSYCLTITGPEKAILAGAPPSSTTANCTTNWIGFGGTTAGRSDLTQPNFVAADVPLSTLDVIAYHNGRGAAAWPTQFPAIAGAIGIALNLKDTSFNQITNANFTTAQICEIFSGAVGNWSDASLSSAFPGHTAVNMPINVEYRSDASGETFALSNFLANNCSNVLGGHRVFETSRTFGLTTQGSGGTPAAGSVISNFFTTLPSSWVGSSGNFAVWSAVGDTQGSIGYVEAAIVHQLNLVGISNVPLAKLNNVDPLAGFGAPITILDTAVVYNQTIKSDNNNNGTAALEAIAGAPSTPCIALVPPASYAVVGSEGSILPPGSYPIVAISYLLGNAQSNKPGDLAATKFLVTVPYSLTVKNAVSPSLIGPGTGLAFLAGNKAIAVNSGLCLH